MEIVDEIIAERQWLYVAIERYPARLIGDIYPQLLAAWERFNPESELVLNNVWEISDRFIDQVALVFDADTEAIINDFVARQIWVEKQAKRLIFNDSIEELLRENVQL